MHNIFETLKYDSNLTIDDYNQVTKEVFFKYFKDESTFIKNNELLRIGLVNYIKYIAKNEKFEKLFENIEIVLSTYEILEKFQSITLTSNQKIIKNTKQIQTLENLQNTILSKLLRGEIKVKI